MCNIRGSSKQKLNQIDALRCNTLSVMLCTQLMLVFSFVGQTFLPLQTTSFNTISIHIPLGVVFISIRFVMNSSERQMNRSSLLVDDFFDLLLRDASVRVGLDSVKTSN